MTPSLERIVSFPAGAKRRGRESTTAVEGGTNGSPLPLGRGESRPVSIAPQWSGRIGGLRGRFCVPAVEAPPRLQDLVPVLNGPLAQAPHSLEQGATQPCELVIHPGRNRGVDRARDEPVPLEPPQGQGQHALGDSADDA